MDSSHLIAMIKRAGPWLALLAWMAIIFWLSHHPANQLVDFGMVDFVVKKSGHFFGYVVLAALAYAATGRAFAAFFIVLLYAISDEYHQTFVAGRNGNIFDVALDCAGGLACLLTRTWWCRWLPYFEPGTR